VAVGRAKVILVSDPMSAANDHAEKLKQVIEILRFLLTVDDEEIIKSSIEGIIEMLQEIS
jgi:hypothetical protein